MTSVIDIFSNAIMANESPERCMWALKININTSQQGAGLKSGD